jgi:predicted transcriptional regulator
MKRDGWTFLTNHGHVLVCLAADPQVLLRDVATSIGITERAVQQMVGDLEQAGAIVRLRVGRRNRYLVRRDEQFRHPVEAGVTIGDFVDLVERGRARAQWRPSARVVALGPAAAAPLSLVD